MGIKPNLNAAHAGGGDKRITTCSACGYGIFDRQDRIWSRYPLGLVHANRADCHDPNYGGAR